MNAKELKILSDMAKEAYCDAIAKSPSRRPAWFKNIGSEGLEKIIDKLDAQVEFMSR